MTMPVLSWPPARTHDVDPPADHYYASALWLLGRHPRLVQLVERVPYVISTDQDGAWFELDKLSEALTALDVYLAAWRDYRGRTWEPNDDAAYARWEAAGPQLDNEAAAAIAPMSRTEVSRLRLLATFAPDPVLFRVSDLAGFDADGQELIRDWARALLAAV
jgi:hypothetical protein